MVGERKGAEREELRASASLRRCADVSYGDIVDVWPLRVKNRSEYVGRDERCSGGILQIKVEMKSWSEQVDHDDVRYDCVIRDALMSELISGGFDLLERWREEREEMWSLCGLREWWMRCRERVVFEREIKDIERGLRDEEGGEGEIERGRMRERDDERDGVGRGGDESESESVLRERLVGGGREKEETRDERGESMRLSEEYLGEVGIR
ncbi:hypothetical protein Tco_0432830 [Tanacetum coccineum]